MGSRSLRLPLVVSLAWERPTRRVPVLRSTSDLRSASSSPFRIPVKTAVANRGDQRRSRAVSISGTSSALRYCGSRFGCLMRGTVFAGLGLVKSPRRIANSKMRWT